MKARAFAILASAILLAGAPAAQLPAISWTCPMHPDVLEDKKGACGICRMDLAPVRLVAIYTCPVHAVIEQADPGACRICARELVQMTAALTYTCAGDRDINEIEPGTCADGSPRVRRYTKRAHGDHNPKHGGVFFMAPDNWHHLEGTHPTDRVFRLYVYDDYARPLPPAELRRLIARVVTEEMYDPATRETKDVRAFPLRASRDGAYLEARIDPAELPAEMTAKVRLKDDAPEYRFDFTFTALTREPATPTAASRTTLAAAAPSSAPPAAPRPETAPALTAASPEPVAAPDPALEVLPIPNSMDEMLAQMSTRVGHVAELIERGNFEAVYVPAFQAKDLAVALEPHLAHLAAAQREAAGPALERVVRTAWLLDAFGDVGNRQQVAAAYAAFSAAVHDVLAAFEGPR